METNYCLQQQKRRRDPQARQQAASAVIEPPLLKGFRQEVQLKQGSYQLSAACLCHPPLLPRMPCVLALVLAGLTHTLTFDLSSRLCPADGGAGQPGVAVTAAELPPELVEAS